MDESREQKFGLKVKPTPETQGSKETSHQERYRVMNSSLELSLELLGTHTDRWGGFISDNTGSDKVFSTTETSKAEDEDQTLGVPLSSPSLTLNSKKVRQKEVFDSKEPFTQESRLHSSSEYIFESSISNPANNQQKSDSKKVTDQEVFRSRWPLWKKLQSWGNPEILEQVSYNSQSPPKRIFSDSFDLLGKRDPDSLIFNLESIRQKYEIDFQEHGKVKIEPENLNSSEEPNPCYSSDRFYYDDDDSQTLKVPPPTPFKTIYSKPPFLAEIPTYFSLKTPFVTKRTSEIASDRANKPDTREGSSIDTTEIFKKVANTSQDRLFLEVNPNNTVPYENNMLLAPNTGKQLSPSKNNSSDWSSGMLERPTNLKDPYPDLIGASTTQKRPFSLNSLPRPLNSLPELKECLIAPLPQVAPIQPSARVCLAKILPSEASTASRDLPESTTLQVSLEGDMMPSLQGSGANIDPPFSQYVTTCLAFVDLGDSLAQVKPSSLLFANSAPRYKTFVLSLQDAMTMAGQLHYKKIVNRNKKMNKNALSQQRAQLTPLQLRGTFPKRKDQLLRYMFCSALKYLVGQIETKEKRRGPLCSEPTREFVEKYASGKESQDELYQILKKFKFPSIKALKEFFLKFPLIQDQIDLVVKEGTLLRDFEAKRKDKAQAIIQKFAGLYLMFSESPTSRKDIATGLLPLCKMLPWPLIDIYRGFDSLAEVLPSKRQINRMVHQGLKELPIPQREENILYYGYEDPDEASFYSQKADLLEVLKKAQETASHPKNPPFA